MPSPTLAFPCMFPSSIDLTALNSAERSMAEMARAARGTSGTRAPRLHHPQLVRFLCHSQSIATTSYHFRTNPVHNFKGEVCGVFVDDIIRSELGLPRLSSMEMDFSTFQAPGSYPYHTKPVSKEKEYVDHPIMGPHSRSFTLTPSAPSTRTQYPYVTGTSVLGIKYKDGVLLASDTAGSYGSTTRYKSVERLKSVGKTTVIGASGEISDFQAINDMLGKLITTDYMWDDGNNLGPVEIHNYLNRIMYQQRNKFDPLWNSLVLGGVKNGKKYLGVVTMIGVHYVDDHVATGFGNHLARPIFRDEWKEDMTLEEGIALLEKCMLVLFYRDRSAINKFQIANVTETGVKITEPYALQTNWSLKAFENPTAGAVGSW